MPAESIQFSTAEVSQRRLWENLTTVTGRHPYDLVIFKCDGVLVNSEPIFMEVLAERLRRIGVDTDARECARLFEGLAQEATAHSNPRPLCVSRMG